MPLLKDDREQPAMVIGSALVFYYMKPHRLAIMVYSVDTRFTKGDMAGLR
jgi:hypothetical protein